MVIETKNYTTLDSHPMRKRLRVSTTSRPPAAEATGFSSVLLVGLGMGVNGVLDGRTPSLHGTCGGGGAAPVQ